MDSTGIHTNRVSPTTPAVDMTSSGVDLHSGNVFKVHMTYDGTTLTMTITDTTNAAKTFTTSQAINIPSIVGGNTALVGFTGGTGSLTAVQNVLNWTMSSSFNPGVTSTPAFSKPGGTYLGTQTISISDSTSGAIILYTLDGTAPATSVGGSTQQYTSAVTVSATETISAIATATGFAPSAVASATYTIESQVATPTFQPGPGTYTSAQSVTLSTTTPGATIYYTTNGTAPTTSSTPYTSAIPVNATETIQAIAAENGFFNSNVASGTYTINLPPAAAPVISPAGGTYATAQTVTITDATSGATIYDTTDGTAPTPSSTPYTASFTVNSTTTVKAIAGGSSFNNSAVTTAAYTIGNQPVNFAAGFTATNLVLNGSAILSGTKLQITDDNAAGYDAGSAWYSIPANIQSFTTDFSFQITPGTTPTADGMAFVIQGNTTSALGPEGGGLGYGPDYPTNPSASAHVPIAKSVAVKFDVYDNAGEGVDSTGIYTNGVSPTTPAVDMTSSGVDLHSGNVFKVHMTYDGTTLTMTITDTTNAAKTFTTSQAINIPSIVGGNTALVGFTGGTGGLTAIQGILTWTFTN